GWNHRRDDESVDRRRIDFGERQEIARQDAVLVHGPVAHGGQPPVGQKARLCVHPQDRVRVSDVHHQKHASSSPVSTHGTRNAPGQRPPRGGAQARRNSTISPNGTRTVRPSGSINNRAPSSSTPAMLPSERPEGPS